VERAAAAYDLGQLGDGKAREGHYALREDSDDGKAYVKDLAFCLEFALENRMGMVARIEDAIKSEIRVGKVDWESVINRNQNHAE
jgi:tRNA-splicing ligase RtcB